MKKFSEMQMKVFLDRYALKDVEGKPIEKTPVEMWQRVANAIASVEPEDQRKFWATEFYNILHDFQFVPGGRILSGAGTGYQVTLNNCYVLPSPKDSREGITDSLRQWIEIMSTGGGVGINLSSLRPRGARVYTVNGTSSGAVSWGEIFSDATGLVIQGGTRRGAAMIMLEVWHADIEEFIRVKEDLSRYNNANLSVLITNDFMKAVYEDKEWDLIFPDTTDPDYDTLWDGNIRKWREMGKPIKVYKTVKARDLWNQIITSAWKSAEPGLFFIDNARNMANSWYYDEGLLIATNPCFVGSTRLATDKGLLTFEELYKTQEPIQVLTDLRAEDEAWAVVGGSVRHSRLGVVLRPSTTVFKTGEKVPVYRLTTKHGYEVVATPNHKFLTPSGYVMLQDLKPGDVLYLQSSEGTWSNNYALPQIHLTPEAQAKLNARIQRGEANPPKEWSQELGQFLGWLVGDGYVYDHNGKPRMGLYFGNEKAALMPYFRNMVKEWFGIEGTTSDRYNTVALHLPSMAAQFAMSLGVLPEKAHEKRVPKSIWRAPREAVIGFLQGLFTTDGTVNRNDSKGSCSIRLSSSSKQLLQDVQLLLLNLGIVSSLHLRRNAKKQILPDSNRNPKEYDVQACYELLIDKENRDRFVEIVGFLTEKKQEKALEFIRNKKRSSNREYFTTEVASIEFAGYEDVYDVTEPVTHSVIANGIVAHNCGEQPLPAYGICNLGAINLSKFAHWDGTFDWHDLRQTVQTAVRFLDNVVDYTHYPLPETERQQKNERRIGLGVMGLGHALIKLGVRYGSPESIEWVESIFREIRDAAYSTSVCLAAEKGPFPKFDADKYLEGGFAKTLPDDIRKMIRKHGIRNVTLLTVAPTGTTSLLAGTSSGIEPVFAFKMKRTDRLGEHIIIDPIYQEWIEMHGEDADLPDYFVEAYDVTPEEHVAVQAAAQKYVDAAISKTANMPEDATVDDVRRLYESAHKAGLKGLTVYRAGSRAAVLETLDKEKKDEEPKQEEQKLEPKDEIVAVPSRVNGVTFREKTAVGTLRAIVNEHEGEPIEVLCILGKGGMDVTADCEAIGRLISLILRLPSPIPNREKLEYVIEQLDGILGTHMGYGFGPNRVDSLPDAIAKALRRYLNGEGVMEKVGEWHHVTAYVNTDSPFTITINTSQTETKHTDSMTVSLDMCPECGHASLVNQSGCYTCYSCGFSKCG